MSRSFDSVVVGGGANGLTAAIHLARAGSKVLLAEAAAELGGTFRAIEFAPGFRASPLMAPIDPTVVALGEGVPPLVINRSVEQTAQGLKQFSAKDAQRWPDFSRQVDALTGFLAQLYRVPPPRIDASTFGELLELLKLGLKFRALSKRNMIELMRTLPMSAEDWLDDWFESDRLKGVLAALAVTDVSQGPVSGGTAFTFLNRHVSTLTGSSPSIATLAEQARAAGVTLETDTAVERFIVREDRIAGAHLSTGEEIACHTVLSSLDAHRSLLELLDPVHLDYEFIQAVRNIRYRGVTTKVLLALDSLPAVPGLSGPPAGSLVIAPSTRYVERAYDAVKYGRCSDQPFVCIDFHSIAQRGLAPSGRHVAILHVQFTPYTLREGSWDAATRDQVADRAIALADRHLPGFSSHVQARSVLAPPDLEARFGLREGAVSQGEMMLDQILFMRPVAGASRYAMPVPGLYLCGASTHPGPGMIGQSGLLAARAVLADR